MRARGLGQGIAEGLDCEGAKLIEDCVGDPEDAEKTERASDKAGGNRDRSGGATNMEGDRRMVDMAQSRFSAPDILVNNACMEHRDEFWNATEVDYDKVLAVNLRGLFFLTKAFVRRLRDAGKSERVVNISSVREDMAFPGSTTYFSSKGGLRMLMRDLAVELGLLGIKVNNVAQGAVATPINTALLNDEPKLNALLAKTLLGRLGSAEDVAGLVAFLASDEASYVTGATSVVDGGLMRNYYEQ